MVDSGFNAEWLEPAYPPAHQVLANLMGNALKYSRPRSRAEIEIGCASGSGEELVFYVRDTRGLHLRPWLPLPLRLEIVSDPGINSPHRQPISRRIKACGIQSCKPVGGAGTNTVQAGSMDELFQRLVTVGAVR